MNSRLPNGSEIDPVFDGHAERALLDLTVEERLDWIWAAMQLLRLGEAQRLAKSSTQPPQKRNVPA